MVAWLETMADRILAEYRAKDRRAKPKVLPFLLPNGNGGCIVDAGDDKPARKVRPGWQSRSVGTFCSQKADSPLTWESTNEQAAMLLCEYTREVLRIRSQPLTIFHTTDGKVTRTYPDIEIVLTNGERRIVQVKSSRHLEDPEIFERLERDRVALEACDWTYEVWTDAYVRKEPRYSNLKAVHYYRHHEPAVEVVEQVRELLRKEGELSAGQLSTRLGSRLALEPTLLPLVCRQILEFDVKRPFGPEAAVRLAA